MTETVTHDELVYTQARREGPALIQEGACSCGQSLIASSVLNQHDARRNLKRTHRRHVRNPRSRATPDSGRQVLTPRSEQAEKMFADGMTPEEIADKMGVGYATVRTYLNEATRRTHQETHGQALIDECMRRLGITGRG